MRWHRYYWLLAPFTLPNVLISLLLAAFYRPTSARWHDGCLELVAGTYDDGSTRIWGSPGAQCLGCQVVWFRSERHRDKGWLAVHERVHAIHGLWGLGVVFAVAYLGHFLYEWARDGFGQWRPAYRRIWSERIAYRIDHEYMVGLRPEAWGDR